MSELSYIQSGDYFIPALMVEDATEDIGKYGSLRRTYLKQYHKSIYSSLLLSGKLWCHLVDINQAAQERTDQIVRDMALRSGLTESLKASDQIEWVRRINNIKASAEEIVLYELVYI